MMRIEVPLLAAILIGGLPALAQSPDPMPAPADTQEQPLDPKEAEKLVADALSKSDWSGACGLLLKLDPSGRPPRRGSAVQTKAAEALRGAVRAAGTDEGKIEPFMKILVDSCGLGHWVMTLAGQTVDSSLAGETSQALR